VLLAKFDEYGLLFIGVRGPTHRGDRVPTLSIYKPNSNSASYGRFLEGDELRVGYVMETEFPGRVNSVKENTLSGISSPGLVGLAPGYDSSRPG
jgi:hypothetical protein